MLVKLLTLSHVVPEDTSCGPSVYTVTQQFIKPVTEAAGNVSWALMKHPEGLLCDVFITHGWAEGIYEFVDKVENSWPRGGTAAYVCFLSNPQNLDISDLIRSPRESPFARALESSSSMLVIPNHVSSIYSRIWCVYEAFLAHTWNKPIRVAQAPVPTGSDMLRVSCVGLSALAAGLLTGISQATYFGLAKSTEQQLQVVRNAFFYSAAAFGCGIMFLFVMRKHHWIACQLAIYVFAICLETWLLIMTLACGQVPCNVPVLVCVRPFPHLLCDIPLPRLDAPTSCISIPFMRLA